MIDESQYTGALGDLRATLAGFKPLDPTYEQIVTPRDEVFARFRPIFSSEHAPSMTSDEFASFLYFENNRHWTGLYRQGLRATTDIARLRVGIAVLLDEAKPIQARFGEAIDMVGGLGKGIASAILVVAYPEKYGVWNNTSEGALRQLGLWPDFERGESVGSRYEKINIVLLRLAHDLGIDLWTLDAAWWFYLSPDRLPQGPATQAPFVGPTATVVEPLGTFTLERQLEIFLLENWDHTPLGRDWKIYEDRCRARGRAPIPD